MRLSMKITILTNNDISIEKKKIQPSDRPGAALLRSAADPKVGIFNVWAICGENDAR